MKRLFLLFALLAVLLSQVTAQQTKSPTRAYNPATLQDALEMIQSAKREIWLLAPTLKNVTVYRALNSRIKSGVILRLLIASKQGYTGYEVYLARAPNVDARWLPERWGTAMLVVDDRAMVTSPLLTGISTAGTSIKVTQPELVAVLAAPLKQVFAQSRKLK